MASSEYFLIFGPTCGYETLEAAGHVLIFNVSELRGIGCAQQLPMQPLP